MCEDNKRKLNIISSKHRGNCGKAADAVLTCSLSSGVDSNGFSSDRFLQLYGSAPGVTHAQPYSPHNHYFRRDRADDDGDQARDKEETLTFHFTLKPAYHRHVAVLLCFLEYEMDLVLGGDNTRFLDSNATYVDFKFNAS